MKYGVLFCILLLISACSSKPYVVDPKQTTYQHEERTNVSQSPSDQPYVIYVVSNSWHTGFVISAKSLQSKIPALYERFGESPYLEIGWGDKGFYQAKEITTSITLKAIFWPSGSVVHVVAVPDDIKGYFSGSHIEKVCLNEQGYQSLIQFIRNSFARTKQNDVISIKHGIYGNSQFYEGVGDYYMMNTCNKWTAKGLKSAGFDIFLTFKLTADSVMNTVKDYNNPSRPEHDERNVGLDVNTMESIGACSSP
ncbi:TIGR02117 family protein [Zooshikella harenae]|uniref:TIGR02117 family protein n=1 Tax=Zooshikella harenae TaxID=2827238 RepID=A0ABS5ZEX6_9GAMM|nr:TIGR02117 family protein [Zooshikella harenae]MBU2712393.1 TIGR02117 family protein [Zooshikella harenae]